MRSALIGLAFLVVTGLVNGGGTVTEPDIPSWFPSEGPCSAVCKTTIPLEYVKSVRYPKKKTISVWHLENGRRKSNTETWATMKTVEWFTRARCITKTRYDTEPCPCRFEDLQAVRYTFTRTVGTKPIVEEVTAEVSGKVPLKGGKIPVGIEGSRKVVVALERYIGPWKLVGTNYFSRNCCWCLNAQKPKPPRHLYPDNKEAPVPTSGSDGVPTTEEEVPEEVFEPSSAWPTRRTNAMCFSSGTCVYTSSSEATYGEETRDVFAGTWTLGEPNMEPMTKKYIEQVTVTWEVTNAASCCTRNDHRPNAGDPTAHQKPCTPCELEAVPKGEATTSTSRSLKGVKYEKRKVSYVFWDPTGTAETTVTRNVVVDFTLDLTDWSDPATPAFSETEDKCSCTSLTVVTGMSEEDYSDNDPVPESESDPKREHNDERERKCGESEPIPRTGG